MKKLILALAIFGFVLFGVFAVQNVVAATAEVEIVNFDKDPEKDKDSKKKKSEARAETKSAETTAVKSGCCAEKSSCGDKSKSYTAKKEDCSKECPDKK